MNNEQLIEIKKRLRTIKFIHSELLLNLIPLTYLDIADSTIYEINDFIKKFDNFESLDTQNKHLLTYVYYIHRITDKFFDEELFLNILNSFGKEHIKELVIALHKRIDSLSLFAIINSFNIEPKYALTISENIELEQDLAFFDILNLLMEEFKTRSISKKFLNNFSYLLSDFKIDEIKELFNLMEEHELLKESYLSNLSVFVRAFKHLKIEYFKKGIKFLQDNGIKDEILICWLTRSDILEEIIKDEKLTRKIIKRIEFAKSKTINSEWNEEDKTSYLKALILSAKNLDILNKVLKSLEKLNVRVRGIENILYELQKLECSEELKIKLKKFLRTLRMLDKNKIDISEVINDSENIKYFLELDTALLKELITKSHIFEIQEKLRYSYFVRIINIYYEDSNALNNLHQIFLIKKMFNLLDEFFIKNIKILNDFVEHVGVDNTKYLIKCADPLEYRTIRYLMLSRNQKVFKAIIDSYNHNSHRFILTTNELTDFLINFRVTNKNLSSNLSTLIKKLHGYKEESYHNSLEKINLSYSQIFGKTINSSSDLNKIYSEALRLKYLNTIIDNLRRNYGINLFSFEAKAFRYVLPFHMILNDKLDTTYGRSIDHSNYSELNEIENITLVVFPKDKNDLEYIKSLNNYQHVRGSIGYAKLIIDWKKKILLISEIQSDLWQKCMNAKYRKKYEDWSRIMYLIIFNYAKTFNLEKIYVTTASSQLEKWPELNPYKAFEIYSKIPKEFGFKLTSKEGIKSIDDKKTEFLWEQDMRQIEKNDLIKAFEHLVVEDTKTKIARNKLMLKTKHSIGQKGLLVI